MVINRFGVGYMTGATMLYGLQKVDTIGMNFWVAAGLGLLVYMVIENIATNYISK